MEVKHGEYTAKDIQILEDLEAVRRRPSMYIGDTGHRGLHHLVNEVVDNSIDEALAGYCTKIEVIIHRDGSITVRDNGRGIPVDMHECGKPAVEVVLTTLHSGGKFDHKVYKVSGGLHGVGVSVVNALSEWLEVRVRRDGKVYYQRYERGKPVTPLEVVGECEDTGTEIRFLPDRQIFTTVDFSYGTILNRLRDLSFLNRGISIRLADERSGREDAFQGDGGLVSFVRYLNRGKEVLHDEPIYFEKEKNGTFVEVAMQYTTEDVETILSFVNNVQTVEGGTHVVGFKAALTKVMNDYGKNAKILKDLDLTGEDVREGLTAVLNVRIPDPQFEGQTKTKLGNSEMKGIVESIVAYHLSEFLERNPQVAQRILDGCIRAARARLAARRARELVKRKNGFDFLLPGKLSDCSESDVTKRELFIVEGDSAGGSAKQGRDRRYQAVLPLRGKILNVEKARLDKILKNEEIRSLITALGTGIGGECDVGKCRYGKIIIATDADVDGSHIRTLLLTLFYRYLRPIVEAGYVYIAQPPLYRIAKGEKVYYAYNDREKDALLQKLGNATVQRFKGLGEMNSEQLWETTMDPSKRVLKRVTIEDAALANEIFSILMGERVEPRRKFIEEHAREVMNLDV